MMTAVGQVRWVFRLVKEFFVLGCNITYHQLRFYVRYITTDTISRASAKAGFSPARSYRMSQLSTYGTKLRL